MRSVWSLIKFLPRLSSSPELEINYFNGHLKQRIAKLMFSSLYVVRVYFKKRYIKKSAGRLRRLRANLTIDAFVCMEGVLFLRIWALLMKLTSG